MRGRKYGLAKERGCKPIHQTDRKMPFNEGLVSHSSSLLTMSLEFDDLRQEVPMRCVGEEVIPRRAGRRPCHVSCDRSSYYDGCNCNISHKEPCHICTELKLTSFAAIIEKGASESGCSDSSSTSYCSSCNGTQMLEVTQDYKTNCDTICEIYTSSSRRIAAFHQDKTTKTLNGAHFMVKQKHQLKAPSQCKFFKGTPSWLRIFFTTVILISSCAALPIRWEISSYGECSVPCGRGVQSRSVVCRKMPEGVSTARARGGMRLPEIMCPAPKPPTTRACSLAACAPEWTPGSWSECSRTCGRGVQVRELQCTQRLATGLTESVPEDYCSHSRPQPRRKCSVSDCPPRYIVKQWTECSVTCGSGIQLREVMCMRIPAGGHRAEEVSIGHCSRLKIPVLQRPCKKRKCRAGNPSSHVPSREARIVTEDRTYIQRTKESKVRLVVGMKAYVLPMATVIIRCPVLRYKKALIYWKFNGTEIETDGDHLTLLADGSFRIRRVKSPDVGRYTCVAGDAEADLILHLVGSGAQPPSKPFTRKYIPEVGLDVSSRSKKFTEDRNINPDAVDRHGFPNIVKPTNRQYPTLSGSIRGTARSSEMSAAVGGELEQRAPPMVDIRSGLYESGAHPPKPITISTDDKKWEFPELEETQDPATLNGLDEHLEKELAGLPAADLKQLFPPGAADNASLEAEDADLLPSLAIPETISPEEELLLLLRAAGVKKPNEEVQNILSDISASNSPSDGKSLNDDGGINHIEILPPPVDLSLSPGKINRNSDSGENAGIDVDLLDTKRSEHQGFISIPNFQRPSAVHVINIPEEVSSKRFSHPRILTQPTEPPMQLDPEIVTYVGGTLIVSDAESVTLICEASGYPTPTLQWFKDETKIVSGERQIILPDHSLRLLRPTRADGGSYRCEATNSLGSDSASTSLNVAVVPQILSTITERFDISSRVVEVPIGSIIKARLGATVRISCTVEGYPEPYVEWQKDVSGLGDNMRVLPDNSLEIRPTTTADQGVYSCEASNPVGTDYQASALVLFDPPHIDEKPLVIQDLEINGVYGFPQPLTTGLLTADYRIKTGTSVIMGCPVTGFPEPSMAWKFNGRPLQEVSHRLEYQLLRSGSLLQLPDVDAGAAGIYSCHSSNGGGNLTTSLNLQLIEYKYIVGNLTSCTATCGGKGTQQQTLVCQEDGLKPVDQWYCTGVAKPAIKTLPCNRVDCPPRFHFSQWGPCTRTCGKGERTRKVMCRVVRSDDSVVLVRDSECMAHIRDSSDASANSTILTRPVGRESCLMEACPSWKPGPWSQCSRKCYGRGTSSRVRRLFCVKANGTHVPRSECRQQGRPRRREYCRTSRCAPIWIASGWSRCSHSCGVDGIQTRILSCVYRGNRRQRAGALCPKDSRPPVTATCNRINCEKGQNASSPPTKATCVDKSKYCSVAKSSGLCGFYKYLCCKTCR